MECIKGEGKLRVLTLMGSPRVSGNTAELCKPFLEELKKMDMMYAFQLNDNEAFVPDTFELCQHAVGLYFRNFFQPPRGMPMPDGMDFIGY